MAYRIGIDVGGTNTDAVILDNNLEAIAEIKVPTTDDVSSGIIKALHEVLEQTKIDRKDIKHAMLGTTHATNAIVERKHLNNVLVIRIGLPATASIKPLLAWPEDLRDVIGGHHELIHGGHEFDGREIAELDEEAIRKACENAKGKVSSVAVTSVFSPVTSEHEKRAKEIIKEVMGEDMPVTLSNEIGSIGLLERENATVLNAALVDVAKTTIEGFEEALKEQGIEANIYLGQNDGTLMSVEYAKRFPILTIACGPTNSIRGASFLAKNPEAIVVDVGGTTTDVGVLVSGFPRESALAVEIGGVRTNFRMPDLVSIGLGGGSIVRQAEDGSVTVGPDSVGYKLTEKALVFDGDVITATDIAVAKGVADIGDKEKVKSLDPEMVEKAWAEIDRLVEDAIDRMKTSAGDMPVVLVGGGSIVVSDDLEGASSVSFPKHHDVANAIGSAIAQVSGQIERIYSLDQISRSEALDDAKSKATNEAISAGADPETIEIVDVEDVPLAYVPGNATRVRVKAAGNLLI